VSVVPGHAEKVFIPYTGVLPVTPADTAVAPSSTDPKPTEATDEKSKETGEKVDKSTDEEGKKPIAAKTAEEAVKEAAALIAKGPGVPASSHQPARHVIIHATVTSVSEDWIEVDRDLLEHEADFEGDDEEVAKLTDELEAAKLGAEEDEKTPATRRLSWDYLVFVRFSFLLSTTPYSLSSPQALGCTLPPPLVSDHITKKEGVAFLSVRSSASPFPLPLPRAHFFLPAEAS
jgi:hypothetical protein